MSYDFAFFHAATPPPPVSEISNGWTPGCGESAETLRHRIGTICPGIDWSDTTWGSFVAARFSLEFNMGPDATINHFAIHARGGDGVPGIIRQLATMPGWYALDMIAMEWLHGGAAVADTPQRFSKRRTAALSRLGAQTTGSGKPRPG